MGRGFEFKLRVTGFLCDSRGAGSHGRSTIETSRPAGFKRVGPFCKTGRMPYQRKFQPKDRDPRNFIGMLDYSGVWGAVRGDAA